MKSKAPILLALAGWAMLLSQQKTVTLSSIGQSIQQLPASSAISPTIRKQIVQAQAQVLKQQDAVLKAKELAKTDTAAAQQVKDAQKKLEEQQKAAQTVVKQAAPQESAPKFVSAEQRKHLTDLVSEFYQEVQQAAKSAFGWEVGLIVAGMSFGLVSAILSIFSLNKAAAIASALVVVLGGVPKVYPIHERAAYYRTLTNQSYSLLGNLQIPFQMAAGEYDDGVARLKVLQDYRATRFPQSSDTDATTQDLFKDLNASKTTAIENH